MWATKAITSFLKRVGAPVSLDQTPSSCLVGEGHRE